MLMWLMNLGFAGGSGEQDVWTVLTNTTTVWTVQINSTDTWTVQS